MADEDRLLLMRAGVTGEDFLEVRRGLAPFTDRVTIDASGGLSSSVMTLDKEAAEALRDALTEFLTA